MSLINDLGEKKIKGLRKDPHYQPIIDEIKQSQHDGITSDEVVETALKATRDQFVKEGRKLDKEDLRKDAFLAATAASVEAPYQMKDMPEGSDKTKHYLLWGAMAAKIDQSLDALGIIPAGARKKIAIGLSMSVGYLKEVADLFTSGFNREDLKADQKGVRSPFEHGNEG